MLGLFYNFRYKIRFLFLEIFHPSNFLEYSLCQLSNRVFKVKNKTPFLFGVCTLHQEVENKERI